MLDWLLRIFVTTVYAQGSGTSDTRGGSGTIPAGPDDPLLDPTGSGADYTSDGLLRNPLGGNGINDVGDLIQQLVDIVFMVGVPLVALAIIYSGFLFVTAQGNPQKITDAKNTLFWTIVGAVIVLGAGVISSAIGGTVRELLS